MLNLPIYTAVNRIVPKNAFEQGLTSAQKKDFTRYVSKITWLNKLAKETVNLPTKTIQEIQIFKIELKERHSIDNIVDIIQRQIPYSLILVITYGDEYYLSTSAKHLHVRSTNKSVIDCTFSTNWLSGSQHQFQLCLSGSLDHVLFDFCCQLVGISTNTFNSFEELIKYNQYKRGILKEISDLKALLLSNIPFNKKVELNKRLRSLESAIQYMGLIS
jgi:hypothetical protein